MKSGSFEIFSNSGWLLTYKDWFQEKFKNKLILLLFSSFLRLQEKQDNSPDCIPGHHNTTAWDGCKISLLCFVCVVYGKSERDLRTKMSHFLQNINVIQARFSWTCVIHIFHGPSVGTLMHSCVTSGVTRRVSDQQNQQSCHALRICAALPLSALYGLPRVIPNCTFVLHARYMRAHRGRLAPGTTCVLKFLPAHVARFPCVQ